MEVTVFELIKLKKFTVLQQTLKDFINSKHKNFKKKKREKKKPSMGRKMQL